MDGNRALAEAHVGAPILAGAFFRVRWDMRLQGAGILGALLTFAMWLVPRLRSKLPSSAFIAVTADDVCVLEFRFGPPRVERVAFRWARDRVRAKAAGENRYSVDISVDDRTIELEALKYDDDSAAVVDCLVGRTSSG